MNRPRFQFKLRFLLSLSIAVSVIVAFFVGPSLVTFSALLTGCCVFLFSYFPHYRAHPVLVGASVGIALVTLLVGAMVAQVVFEAPRFQGQLYHEDGPEAFFIILFMFWVATSFLVALFGMLVGVVVDMFLEFVHSDAADARFVRQSTANLFHRFNRIEPGGAAGRDEAGEHADEDGDGRDDQDVAE